MNRTIKKFLIAFLAAICLTCIVFAAACTEKRFTLTYVTDSGVTIEAETENNSKVYNNAQIKSGVQINFTLVIADNAEGEPVVSINGKQVEPNSDGVYSFKMTEDTTVTVTGVYLMNTYKVVFDKSYKVSDDNGNEYTYVNNFLKYLDTEGKEIEMADATTGEEVSFKVHVSVYYGQNVEYSVLANTTLITPDSDGVYKFTVTSDITVTVTGLPTDLGDKAFTGRADGGAGTREKPFLIREPVDLYAMADFIEDDFYTDGFFQTAYYRLENDIDLKGEQLYVIGNTLTQLSAFAGNFDGNGHTIKNYTMTNVIIEQSGFGNVYLPYVGLFGFAPMAVIYDLNLEDFTIEIQGTSAEDEANMGVGGLVGYARGTVIQNCSVNGKILMQGGSDKTSFLGGLVGMIESYTTEEESYTASIVSCSTDVEVGALSGFIYSAGGIAGLLSVYDERTTAYILNCYALGDVYGAMRAGGIAGQLGPYTSVKNCYATGYIEADNDLKETTGNEVFSYAYAGGIAAYAEYGSIISNCFFTGTTEANAAAVGDYEVKDGIVAGIEGDGTTYVYTDGALMVYCYTTDSTSVSGANKVSSVTGDIIKNELGWSAADWNIPSSGLPQINRNEADKTYTVTIEIDGKAVYEWAITNYYDSMGHWYAYNAASVGTDRDEGIPEFIDKDGNRTYGYFFDKELKIKIPFGYVPTDDMTVYAGYVNYEDVAGIYYLQGQTGYLELTTDGAVFYRNGALNVISTYVYNGKDVVLYNTFLAILVDSEMYDFYTFKANVADGVMSIYDYEIYPANSPLIATKKIEGFGYGTYYDAQNNQYTFNESCSGIEKTADGTVTGFTFTILKTASGYEVSVKYGAGGATRECTVADDGTVVSFNNRALTAYDNFKGVWESKAGVNRQYSFDGKGNWTYEYYDYSSNGDKVVFATESGTYSLNGGILTLDGKNIVAEYSGQFLSIGNESFYKENSFAGVWKFSGRPDRNEPIEITFNGIGIDGYGTALVSYLNGGSIETNYSAFENNGTITVILYYYHAEWGYLTLNKTNNTLCGSFYSNMQQTMLNNVIFCLYDNLKGTWDGADGDITSLKFDGLGAYDIKGSVSCLATSGHVYVNEGSGLSYTLEAGGLKGSFKYNGKTYTFEYSMESDKLILTCGDDSTELSRRAE